MPTNEALAWFRTQAETADLEGNKEAAGHARAVLEMVEGPIGLIAAERRRQEEEEGWTPRHDDEHTGGELADAAACYAMTERGRRVRTLGDYGVETTVFDDIWPWAARHWKPTPGERVRELVKAGALIAAEIERLQRAQEATHG